jgi:predicted GTPase
MDKIRVLIMGAAGRDFHDFNLVFRDDPRHEVVAFTAAQIPGIAGRRYPPALAGPQYPDGIPIYPEEELDSLIRTHHIDQVIFAYSDLSHEEVMHKASRVLASGAEFRLLGPRATMLVSPKPVVSVCAVRTGCGKSPASRKVAAILQGAGLRVVIVRHPMPYGDLEKQAVQRFASVDDLRRCECTIEEMEEYEPHLARGLVVYAGVDYARILSEAEQEADVILWDGGNNDLSFYVPDLEIVLLDAQRAGHERSYFPGEVNFLRGDVLVLTKIDGATPEQIELVRGNIQQYNPRALVINSTMAVFVQNPDVLPGRRVLVVEDGPTLTHGGMSFGAGTFAAKKYGAHELVDPRPFAVGSIKDTFTKYPQIGRVLPAMGYAAAQIRELELTIERTPCDLVMIGTPVDLGRHIRIRQPTCRVTYELEEIGSPTLRDALEPLIRSVKAQLS